MRYVVIVDGQYLMLDGSRTSNRESAAEFFRPSEAAQFLAELLANSVDEFDVKIAEIRS